MVLKNIWLLPVSAFCTIFGTFLITYAIAIAEGHVDAFFPFISDTGAIAPESCIFGQLLNIGAVLLGLCIYLRHRQIVEFYEHGVQRKGRGWRISSTIMLWLGLTSAFGVSLVANFQETRQLTVHLVGAFMAFILGIIYGWAQTIFTYLIRPRMSSLFLSHSRLIISILGTAFFIAMNCMSFVKNTAGRKDSGTKTFEDHFHWNTTDPDYNMHIASTFCEWLMAASFLLFIATFAVELRHAQLIPPRMILTGKLREEISENTPLKYTGPMNSNFMGVSTPPSEPVSDAHPIYPSMETVTNPSA